MQLNHDKSAVVDRSIKWIPVHEGMPSGSKMMLINRAHGVALVSIYRKSDGWTHYHPLPTFSEPA